MVTRNGPRQARRALGEGERAIGMHQTQDMIRKERPDGQGAEDASGGGGLSGRGRYVSQVKVVFADVPNSVQNQIISELRKVLPNRKL